MGWGGIKWDGMVNYGIGSDGMVWYGILWYVMVWCGMAFVHTNSGNMSIMQNVWLPAGNMS